MMSSGLKDEGLDDKYMVYRRNSDEHLNCRYFVLDPQHDPLAVVTMRFYAKQARANGFTKLAEDMLAWIRGLDD